MKERPILFSAPMVRAILESRKTQTRRVVKPESGLLAYLQDGYGYRYRASYKPGSAPAVNETPGRPHTEIVLPYCPYGQPGDRLWVREAVWLPRATTDKDLRDGADTWPKCIYSADTDATEIEWMREHRWKQRPSIHCPRWASRITLELTDVRVERLQDISHEDAEQEGVLCNMSQRTFRDHFRTLWDRINGDGAWLRNPWVWVVSFQRVQP